MALVPKSALFIGAGAPLTLASGAGATTFSFASDDDSGAFTPLTLRVDDDNGALPTLSFAAGLLVNLNATYAGSIGAGSQTHVYGVSGTFSFVRPSDNATLINVSVSPGAARLAITGSSVSWGSAGGLAGGDMGLAQVTYDTFGLFQQMLSQGPSPLLYGMNLFYQMEDFAFTMTMVNSGLNGVTLDQAHTPTPWQSEASFSGHAIGVPAPAGAAVMALAGVGLARRRRTR